jgi:4-amino-4-deoxy-L-arabinose transferase-like glycosyltransferase
MDDPRCFLRSACVVVAVALATRFAVLAAFWSTWIWQTGHVHDDWNTLAINWIAYGTFGFAPGQPTTKRGPIFPLMEIPLYLLFGENYAVWSMALLLFDAGTSLLLVLLGRRLWGSRAALFAGLFHAVHLPLVYYSAQIEQFTSVLPLVFVWFYLISAWDLRASSKPHYVACGVVSGILILSKTVYLPIVVGSGILLIWRRMNQSGSKTLLRQVALMLLVTALVVAPWTYRNYVVTEGKFIPVQSLFWSVVWQKFVITELDAREGWDRPPGRTLEVLLAAQKDLARKGSGDQDVEKLREPQRELYYESAYRRQALEWIREDPAAYGRNVLSNMWHFWVRAENLNKTLLMALIQAPFLGAALIGLWFTVKYRLIHQVRFGLVLILILWAEHSLVFAWGRFSLDTVPVLAFVFGVGIDAWLRHRTPHSTTSVGRLSPLNCNKV